MAFGEVLIWLDGWVSLVGFAWVLCGLGLDGEGRTGLIAIPYDELVCTMDRNTCWVIVYFNCTDHLMHARGLFGLMLFTAGLGVGVAALRCPANDLQRQDNTTPARQQQGTLFRTSNIWPKTAEIIVIDCCHFHRCSAIVMMPGNDFSRDVDAVALPSQIRNVSALAKLNRHAGPRISARSGLTSRKQMNFFPRFPCV